jgi:hypothetical protein
MRPLVLVALPFAFAVAACQQGETTTPGESSQPGADAPAGPASTASPTAATSQDPTTSDGAGEAGIPVALQGNWGMVPADCTSTRGDAKGLLKISGTTLKFYESVAELGTVKERSETSLRADYAFTGEGMSWTRDVTLTASNGGKTLTLLDRGGENPEGPYTYTKCQS